MLNSSKLFLLLSVTFALAKADLVGGDGVVTLHGSGTTNPSKCFWLIMDQFMERIKIPTRLTYRGVGSSTGQKEFIGTGDLSANDFGSGDIPFSTEAGNNLTTAGVDILQFPVLLGAISLFHSVPGVGDEGLRLTSCLIAKIFNRQIVYWDDASIMELNTDMKLPSSNYPITVARRVLGSSSTASVTQYLHESCPADWPAEKVGSTIEWPEDTKKCDGSGAMTKCIRDFPGTIGYLDSGHALAEELDEIELKNRDGNYLSSRTALDKGGVGVPSDFPSGVDQDFGSLNLMNLAGENTWPIVALTYVYVKKDISFINYAEERGLLVAFLEALYNPTYIDQCISLFGFVVLPENVQSIGKAGISMLMADSNITKWIFENDTIPLEGQGDFVISQKRQNYMGLTTIGLTSDVASLEKDVAAITAKLEAMQSQPDVSKITTVAATDDSPKTTAALILSVISIVLWAGTLLFRAHKQSSSPYDDKAEYTGGSSNGVTTV